MEVLRSQKYLTTSYPFGLDYILQQLIPQIMHKLRMEECLQCLNILYMDHLNIFVSFIPPFSVVQLSVGGSI